jgi:hypothetical protein
MCKYRNHQAISRWAPTCASRTCWLQTALLPLPPSSLCRSRYIVVHRCRSRGRSICTCAHAAFFPPWRACAGRGATGHGRAALGWDSHFTGPAGAGTNDTLVSAGLSCCSDWMVGVATLLHVCTREAPVLSSCVWFHPWTAGDSLGLPSWAPQHPSWN